MHLNNEKIIITGKNSNMASTAGLLISILTAGWCLCGILLGVPGWAIGTLSVVTVCVSL